MEIVSLTGLFIHDKKSGYFSAFFKEFPESSSQGKTREEAEKNLFAQLPIIIETRDEMLQDSQIGENESANITEKHYSFAR